MEKNKIDDIYSLLDEITNDERKNDISQKDDNLNGQRSKNLAGIAKTINQNRIVRKPILPSITSYSNRFDCFEKLIENCDYGSVYSESYVEGHKEALYKYLDSAKENPNNLFIAEGKLNDEINKYARASKSSIYVKGYYDGLLYVYKAFKRSKELIADNIYKILKREIG